MREPKPGLFAHGKTLLLLTSPHTVPSTGISVASPTGALELMKLYKPNQNQGNKVNAAIPSPPFVSLTHFAFCRLHSPLVQRLKHCSQKKPEWVVQHGIENTGGAIIRRPLLLIIWWKSETTAPSQAPAYPPSVVHICTATGGKDM